MMIKFHWRITVEPLTNYQKNNGRITVPITVQNHGKITSKITGTNHCASAIR